MSKKKSQGHPVVFISYSQDSQEHKDKVLAFANKLREDGIDAFLDQYEESPREGWPKWMDKQIENSDFVLVVCTETYCRRVTGTEEKGKGLGVRWESTLVYQDVYIAGSEVERFVPVLFKDGKPEHVPKPLKGLTHYYVDAEEGYEDLYRRLTDQPKTTKPSLGKLKSLSPRKPKADFLQSSEAEAGKGVGASEQTEVIPTSEPTPEEQQPADTIQTQRKDTPKEEGLASDHNKDHLPNKTIDKKRKNAKTRGKFVKVIVAILASAVIVGGIIGVSIRLSKSKPFDPIDRKLYPSGTAYTYQPLNPTTVWIRDPTEQEKKEENCLDADETSYEFNMALLRDLDTETVRVALTTLEGYVDLIAGVVGTSVKGQSYVLNVDDIKYITGSKDIDTDYTSINAQGQYETIHFTGTVPMYTGIGLRIKAEFTALEGGLDISGLSALATAASADGITGRLTVQTLGISGPEVTSQMPSPSDISVSSIQNTLQAVASIKAKIYEESTTVIPKIVAFESPGRDPALISAITESIYASEEYICPVLVQDPIDDTKRILMIYWFSPPPEEYYEEEE